MAGANRGHRARDPGSVTLRVVALLAMALLAAPLAAVPLWSVEHPDRPGTILLLGSVHMLRASDHPLPAVVRAAYREADRIVMELRPEELGPEESLAALERVGVVSQGNAAAEALSPEEWRRAEALADAAGLDLDWIAPLEPWFAALTLHSGALATAGYEPALGVDLQVAAWAREDRKPVTALETLDQQLLLFKELDASLQREVLIKTLEELETMGSDTAELVADWRRGDIAALAARIETDFRDYEALRDRLVAERNQTWLDAIENLLDEPGTSLVVVGALHLVGPDGVPSMLAAHVPGIQISIISKSSLPAPQSGQRQLSGTSSHRVPGAIPPSGSPAASSYTYPQITHIQAFIDDPPRR